MDGISLLGALFFGYCFASMAYHQQWGYFALAYLLMGGMLWLEVRARRKRLEIPTWRLLLLWYPSVWWPRIMVWRLYARPQDRTTD
jgi:hypothetical protein